MRPNFRLCDKCKTNKVPEELSFFVCTGSQMDGAGSTEENGVEVDLCHACAIALIRRLCLKPGTRIADYYTGTRVASFVTSKE